MHTLQLWLPLESHVLARVVGSSENLHCGGLVTGVRDLHRQSLKLEWQQNDDTELRCMREIVPTLFCCDCGTAAREIDGCTRNRRVSASVGDAAIRAGRVRDRSWNASRQQHAAND